MTKNTTTPSRLRSVIKQVTKSDTTALPVTNEQIDRIKARLEEASPHAVEKRISALHRQADLLQGFAAQSKRKLSRSKALEQASVLSGYKNYQTAKVSIEKEESDRLALSTIQVEAMCKSASASEASSGMIANIEGKISPWEKDQQYERGEFLIKQFSDSLAVRLRREDSPKNCIEVIFEMDADLPRLCIYTPELSDNPVFSIHSGDPGIVLQYMDEDDPISHRIHADGLGLEMIKKVADTPKCVWFVPRKITDDNA